MNFDIIHQWTEELSSSLNRLELAFMDNHTHYRMMEMAEERIMNNHKRHFFLFEDFKKEVATGFSRQNAGDTALQNLASTLHRNFHGLDARAYHSCKQAALFWDQEEKGFAFRIKLGSRSPYYLTHLLKEVEEGRADRLKHEDSLLAGTGIDREKQLVTFSQTHLQTVRDNQIFESVFGFLLAEVYATKYFLQPYFDSYGLNSSTDQEPVPVEPGGKLHYVGSKVDLAELVWALYKSECITDTTTGRPVAQNELANQLSALLSVDSLNVADSMRYRYGTASKPTSHKAKDGKTFINRLQTLLESRVLD